MYKLQSRSWLQCINDPRKELRCVCLFTKRRGRRDSVSKTVVKYRFARNESVVYSSMWETGFVGLYVIWKPGFTEMLEKVHPHVLTEKIQHMQLCAVVCGGLVFFLPCSVFWVGGQNVSAADVPRRVQMNKSFSVCSHHLVGRAKFCSWSIFLWRN